MPIPKIYNAFDTPPTGDYIHGESLTQQEFADDCNINSMLENQQRTGMISLNQNFPEYSDFTGVTSFQDAIHQIKEAEEQFLTLPPSVRNRFNNDPHQLITFLQDTNNRKEAEDLGIVQSKTLPNVKEKEEVKPS
nr:MAG: internal scaffolding protein [Microviridae sp.]